MESKPIKILVAEDDPISMRVITVTLEKKNYEVIGVADGQDAIDYLRKDSQIDLIVSDVMMPNVDGLGLLQHVRGDMMIAGIPFILCTALQDQASVVKGISLGADDYIVKPIQSDLLIDRINRILKPRSKTQP